MPTSFTYNLSESEVKGLIGELLLIKNLSEKKEYKEIINAWNGPESGLRDFNFEAAQKFIKEILELDSDPEVEEIFVFISSYGGEVYAVLAMIEAIRNCTKPVSTVGLGMCASCASVLLAAGTGDR